MFSSVCRVAIVLGVAFVFSGGSAQARPKAVSTCSAWRPCGGGETDGGNKFIPQSLAGADFRPVCATHDKCYGDGIGTRKQCDDAFLQGLRSACENSSRPHACQRRAKLMYVAVRWFGSGHFDEK